MVHLTGSKFFLASVNVHRINWKLKVMSVVWMLHPGCFSRQLPAAAEDIDSKQGDIAWVPDASCFQLFGDRVRGIRILGVIFFNFLIFMLFTIPFLEVLTDGLQRHQHLWCPVVVFIIPYKVFESIKNVLILKKFTHPSFCTNVISYKPQLPDNILSLHHKKLFESY